MEKIDGERPARSAGSLLSSSPIQSVKKGKTISSGSSRHEKRRAGSARSTKKAPKLTAKQRRQLEALQQLPDNCIDFSDIPQQLEIKGTPYIGLLYRSGKTSVTIRLDADMVEWFKAQGKGWQTKMNWALRLYFASCLAKGAAVGKP